MAFPQRSCGEVLEPILAIWVSRKHPVERSWNLFWLCGIPARILWKGLGTYFGHLGFPHGSSGEVLEPIVAIWDSRRGPVEKSWNLLWPFGSPAGVLWRGPGTYIGHLGLPQGSCGEALEPHDGHHGVVTPVAAVAAAVISCGCSCLYILHSCSSCRLIRAGWVNLELTCSYGSYAKYKGSYTGSYSGSYGSYNSCKIAKPPTTCVSR